MHGGSLSLAIGEERPIIEIGQDEAVLFLQYIYSALTWLEWGKSQVRPKSEGDAVMVSVFVGPSIGCGALTIREPNCALARINAIRKSGDAMVEYKDIESAIEVRGDNGVRKNQFASWQDIQDTLCLTFDHGKNREGYWNNTQITNQAEDVIDILHGLFPNHDLEFHVDNSSGHTKKRKDGLNVNVMNVWWGCKQRYMQPSQLGDGDVGVRLHPYRYQEGHTQSFHFDLPKEEERGPWCLSDDEREARKYDRPTGKMITKQGKDNCDSPNGIQDHRHGPEQV
jgi:hypothetical protein